MARQHGRVDTGSISVGSSWQTVLTLAAPSGQALAINAISVSWKGTSTTQAKPIIRLTRGTASGGSGSSSATIRSLSDTSPQGASFRASAAKGYSAQPSGLTAFAQDTVHAQTNWYYRTPIVLKGGDTLAVECQSATTTDCEVGVEFEE